MATTEAFREIAIKRSTKQPQMVDQLLEESPILAAIPMQESSDGLHNTYEELESVTEAQVVDADEALPVVNAKSKLKQIDLSIFGGLIECGEDKARSFGGFPEYVASKQPAILTKTGNSMEQSILYNNIRATASDAGNLQDAGGTGSTNYSILCVKWVPGQTTGLYDPSGFGRGAVMDVTAINGGSLYKDSNSRLVFGVRYKGYIGIQLANTQYVSGIVNVDIDNDKTPTSDEIEEMLEDARATAGNTFIYCHPRVRRVVFGSFKDGALNMVPADGDYNRLISMWDDIPIVTSRNFKNGDEAKVTVN